MKIKFKKNYIYIYIVKHYYRSRPARKIPSPVCGALTSQKRHHEKKTIKFY